RVEHNAAGRTFRPQRALEALARRLPDAEVVGEHAAREQPAIGPPFQHLDPDREDALERPRLLPVVQVEAMNGADSVADRKPPPARGCPSAAKLSAIASPGSGESQRSRSTRDAESHTKTFSLSDALAATARCEPSGLQTRAVCEKPYMPPRFASASTGNFTSIS